MTLISVMKHPAVVAGSIGAGLGALMGVADGPKHEIGGVKTSDAAFTMAIAGLGLGALAIAGREPGLGAIAGGFVAAGIAARGVALLHGDD